MPLPSPLILYIKHWPLLTTKVSSFSGSKTRQNEAKHYPANRQRGVRVL
jgi:hypothetical protein